MGFCVSVEQRAVIVELSGWDRLMNWRRQIEFGMETISDASVASRAELESMIDHRALGCGTHNGSKRPGRRRIGTMLGRGVAGKQFWAANAGPGSAELVVLDLAGHVFSRAVLEVDDPEYFTSDLLAALNLNQP